MKNINRALMWAVETDRPKIVKALIDAGADIHANNDVALHRASDNGHIEVVELLKRHMTTKSCIK